MTESRPTPTRRLAGLDRQLGGNGSGVVIVRELRRYLEARISTRGMASAFRCDHCIHLSREKVRLAIRDMNLWAEELAMFAKAHPDATVVLHG